MLFVSDLQGSSFPQEFLNVLPTHCDCCGEATEITESLTILRCSNPLCGEKGVQRLVALMKDLGVKNMGESKCRQFMFNFDVASPYAILMYEPSDGVLFAGCSQSFSESIFEEVNKKRRMLLWEYVKIGNLPGIRDSARKLFANYDNLEEFYDDLEDGGISFVQELLSIKGSAVKSADIDYSSDDEYDMTGGFNGEDDDEKEVVSVKAVATYNTLMFFKEELLEALEYVEIKELTTDVINICISTAVGRPFKSKSDFVSQMNDDFGDKIHLNFLGSVSRDCQFLIWSKEGSKTTKVTKVERLNEKTRISNAASGIFEEFGCIEIMTGLEFRDYLAQL
jgi:hypothetical protein